MTHRSRYPRRSRRRAALAPLLLIPTAAALVVAYLARNHHTPTATDAGPELDSFTIEEFVEPANPT